jgi:hypothetical protein
MNNDDALLKSCSILVLMADIMGHEDKTKDDQITGGACEARPGDWSTGLSSLFASLQSPPVYASSAVCGARVATVLQDRLSWHQPDVGRSGRPAESAPTQEGASLLHPLLRRETPAKKGAFEALLNAVFSTARGVGLLNEPVQAAIDSTGLETRHISQHFVRCTKRPSFHRRRWPKMTVLCDTQTHLIAACIITEGPGYDFKLLEPTARQASTQIDIGCLLADAGYDSESNHRFGREVLGIHTIIALNNRGSSKMPGTVYRAEMKTDFDKEAYNNRWQVESVFSRDKRLLGSALRGRGDIARQRECLLRVITHNLMILHCAA